MKLYTILSLFVLSFFVTGCGNSGAFLAANLTEVQLHKNNYQLKALNVTGTAEAAHILGVSHSFGLTTQTFGLIPLKGSETLYKDAREDLWRSYNEMYESPEGKSLALVNVEYDGATINYLLYTKARVTITADVVEFE